MKFGMLLLQLALCLSLCARGSAKLGSTGILYEEVDTVQRILLTQVQVVGDNNSPSSVYPLGLCEGDCDSDSDCQPNLVCFQRDNGEQVPGCSLGPSTAPRADFCVTKSGTGPNQPPSPPSPSPPVPSPPSPSSSSSFFLKLYWQQGYNWQGETFERKWCVRCDQGQNSCQAGDEIIIVDCDDDPTSWRFVSYNNEAQIKVSSVNLCLERSNNHIYQKTCDSGNRLQRWVALNGAFNGQRFEIAPVTNTTKCATQRHEPKYGEDVHLESCTTARKSNTSFWNRY